jgi:outer membrane receptor protein involved in Fe transport
MSVRGVTGPDHATIPGWAARASAALCLALALSATSWGQEAAAADTSAAPGPADAGEPPADGEEAVDDPSWHERIVVTATRSDHRVGDIPLHVTVMQQEEIEHSPEIGLRELFLRVPSINMQSEEGTLQAGVRDGGIAFRGLGGTAQSRSLMLVDGLPVNDPFGGFILFPRIPKDQIERIEVVPGASGAWGNLALSGVVNLITAAPTERTGSVKLKASELDTGEVTVHYTDLGDAWSGWIGGNALDSDGYFALEEPNRAPLDTKLTTSYETFTGKLSRTMSDSAALHLSALSYDEDREQGTPVAAADSREAALSGTVDLTSASGASWQARLFARDLRLEEYESLANGDRTGEILGATLDVPTESLGLGAVWTSAGRGKHSITSGADLYATDVESTADFAPAPAGFTQRIFAEGKQRFAGVFGEDLYTPTDRLRLLFAARFDVLSTLDGRQVDTDLVTGAATEKTLIDRNTETTVNPSMGVVYAASDSTRLRSSVYTGFRAPTAAELFVTAPGRNKNNANPRLEPERLVGGEVGVDFTPSPRLMTRVTGYWSEGRDLVERVLIGRGGPGGTVIEPCGFMPPGATCRLRENVAEVQAKGLEIEQSVDLPSFWRLDLFGTLLESEVTDNPASPALVGNTVLRTPDHAGTLSLAYENPRTLYAVARVTYSGDRWNDVDNTELLESHVMVDVSASRPLGAHFTVFAGVTNLFDDEYLVNFSDQGPLLGAPRMAHVGVRLDLR